MELESWDAWISDDKLTATHMASVAGRYGNRFPGKRPSESELEPEVDYFQEMQLEPSISKTKKVKLSVISYDNCVCHVNMYDLNALQLPPFLVSFISLYFMQTLTAVTAILLTICLPNCRVVDSSLFYSTVLSDFYFCFSAFMSKFFNVVIMNDSVVCKVTVQCERCHCHL